MLYELLMSLHVWGEKKDAKVKIKEKVHTHI